MSAEPDVLRLFSASEQDLLVELGNKLLGDGIGFGVEDPSRARRFAQKWLEQRWDRIRDAVCNDPAVRAAMRGEVATRVLEVATVSDALVTLAGKPAVSVLSVIVLRRGAEAICGPDPL